MSSLSGTARPWLAIYAKLVVLAVFALIFAGGLVTSWGAGMAAPDWPVTFGSLNPAGWWDNFPLRLEHGHRLIATYVGFLTAFLAAAVWRHRGLMIAVSVIAAVHALYLLFGTPHAASHSSAESSWKGSLIAGAIIFAVGGVYVAILAKMSPPAREGELDTAPAGLVCADRRLPSRPRWVAFASRAKPPEWPTWRWRCG